MITFDIETLSTTEQLVIDELRASIKAPATYKKQETIDKWMAENAEQRLQELIAETSFSGMYGRIACIAWAHDDGEVVTTAPNMSEYECLLMFFDYLEKALTIDESLCGHNIVGFDLPFIKHRSIILGIKPPITLTKAFDAKPWDKDFVQDTMIMWSADNRHKRSMGSICKALGITGKGDFDGSMVAETWSTDPQKVIDYCADDVRRTREIYKRITFQTGRANRYEVAA